MKSKITVAFFLMAFLLISQISFSAVTGDIISAVERANALIESMVSQAIQTVSNLDENARGYDRAVKAIGEALVMKTSKISQAVIEHAEKQGVTAVCYDVEIVLGGQTFIIDPIRVIDD